MSSSCLAENTIGAFAAGNLSPEAVVRVEAHAAGCALCRELLGLAMGAEARLEPAASDKQLARGTSIGRYTILSFVGAGGMGKVYAAYDTGLDRRIALKLLRAGLDDQGNARLVREAKALARISHPNVVSVHDVGGIGDRPFVAMEFVDGPTLKSWLAARQRSRAEILRSFVAAAQGLMAAHAAGLVHRDFKPGNVMIARDGSARVTDFGLARVLDDARGEPVSSPPASGAASSLHTTLTVTGQLLGTPRYMAPEQFKAQATDARTDQFSFCVALYEALYGAPPFRGHTVAALSAEVLAGRVQPAAPGSAVPNWLRRALLRGLSVAPERRWPSMRELVGALLLDPAVARRRRLVAASTALIVALSAITLVRNTGGAGALCRSGPSRLAGIWDSSPATSGARASREVAREAFFASGSPSAQDAWERVAPRLDRYVADWRAMYTDACEATHVRSEQKADVLELRMACLDQGRAALVALTNAFATADRRMVDTAMDGVNALPDIQRCADVNVLRVGIVLPSGAARKKVEDLRKRIAVARTQLATGKDVEAVQAMRTLVAEARALGYEPVLAEALAAAAAGTWITPVAEARRIVEEGIWVALGGSRDDLAEQMAVDRASWLFPPFGGNPREVRLWLGLSRALVERAGHAEGLPPDVSLPDDQVYALDSKPRLEAFRRAATIEERILPKGDPRVAATLNNLAEALCRARRFDEALAINERVLEMFVDTYGLTSVNVATVRSNRGECLVNAGRPNEALEPLQTAISTTERDVGKYVIASALLGYSLTALGRALVDVGRARDAEPVLQRAVRLREENKAYAFLLAESRFALARAVWDSGADRSQAVALARRARSGYVNAPPAWDPKVIDGWLATHKL